MASLYPITSPLKVFYGLDGKPLDGGFLYFGAANQNPETNPVTMYWDAAGTIPAAQPLRTVLGYITRQGTPANIYATGDFSVTLKDKNGVLIFTNPTSVDLQLALAAAGSGTAAVVTIADAGSFYTTDNVEAALQQLGPLIALAAAEVVGVVKDYVGIVAPAGYVLASGRTIGNATSSATERANADTANLYTLLWNSSTNTELTIQDSAGTPTARDVSAAVDYAANKRLPVPDCRGRVRAGKDDMGGSTASRITNAGAGIVGTTMGAAGGVQTHPLVTGELAAHTHSITDLGHAHTYQIVQASTAVTAGPSPAYTSLTSAQTTPPNQSTGITGTNSTGSGTAHQNTQPTIIFTAIIKL